MAGLLDFLESPKGIGLLSAVAGGLATAKRGQPINTIGRGLAAGVSGYQQASNNIFDQQDKALQRSLYQQQINAQMENIKAKKAEQDQAKEEGRYWLASMGVNPDNLQGSFMHVSNDSIPVEAYKPQQNRGSLVSEQPQQIDLSSDTPLVAQPEFSYAPPKKAPPIDSVLDELGYSGGKKQYFYSFAQSNPEKAADMLSRQLDAHIKSQWKAKSEGPPRIGFDDALASIAAGIPVPGYQYTQDQAQKIIDSTTSRKERVSKAGASSNVFAPTVAGGKAMETQGKEFGKFAVEATQSAQNAYDAANDINMITEGLRGMGGGPVAEFKASVGKYLPQDSEWGRVASMSELAKTVQAKLAPQMRAAGSGATSDFEMRMWLQSIPTLATTEKGRDLMSKYSAKVAERSQIRAEIINDIERQGRLPTPREISNEMKRRIGDRFFDDQDKAYFGISGKQQSPQPQQKPAQADGWSIQKVK